MASKGFRRFLTYMGQLSVYFMDTSFLVVFVERLRTNLFAAV